MAYAGKSKGNPHSSNPHDPSFREVFGSKVEGARCARFAAELAMQLEGTAHERDRMPDKIEYSVIEDLAHNMNQMCHMDIDVATILEPFHDAVMMGHAPPKAASAAGHSLGQIINAIRKAGDF